MQILINHLGYEKHGVKTAVIKGNGNETIKGFVLIDLDRKAEVFQGTVKPIGKVDQWKDWFFYQLDFSDWKENGRYVIKVQGENLATDMILPENVSPEFPIGEDQIFHNTISSNLDYFKTQRCTGEYDRHDRAAHFVGDRSNETRDVSGGWYDASGDVSKYLSHLSYANYMNPQQIPMTVWGLIDVLERIKDIDHIIYNRLSVRLLDEAFFGADFLVRILDPAGYFYMTIFDKWSKDPSQREICSYETEKGFKFDQYQAGWRQGAGMAIAALAKAANVANLQQKGCAASGDFERSDYLKAAETGFEHLLENNEKYLDDGKENIIDDYCCLMAAVELFKTTGKDSYLQVARERADKLIARQTSDDNCENWWRADDAGERPYFHAAEAGLPIISLVQYLNIETDSAKQQAAKECIRKAAQFELSITTEVDNPFGYGRQYVKGLNEEKRTAFFFPHNNESGYWWQGENARLGSLAAAARMAAAVLQDDQELVQQLEAFAVDQINWILGLNPYDMCMLYGFGRNNPDYVDGFPSSMGGICNGITGGFKNERDIDFKPKVAKDDFAQNWRWGEQWIPHATWYMIAIAQRER